MGERDDRSDDADRRGVSAEAVEELGRCATDLGLGLDLVLEQDPQVVAIRTVGAYGFSMSSTYNQRPRPAEVMVRGAEATLVRRRETLEDLVAAELGL